jgi:hypothetical protein
MIPFAWVIRFWVRKKLDGPPEAGHDGWGCGAIPPRTMGGLEPPIQSRKRGCWLSWMAGSGPAMVRFGMLRMTETLDGIVLLVPKEQHWVSPTRYDPVCPGHPVLGQEETGWPA